MIGLAWNQTRWERSRFHPAGRLFGTNRGDPASTAYNFNSRIASPAPLRLASRISEYFRDRSTPGAPARRAARTAAFTLCGVHLLLLGSVGISISMPGQIRGFVPAT